MQFAEIFAAQIGQSLDDALAEMSAEHIHALDLIGGCDQGDQGGAPQLEWTREGLLETTIDSTCGDPWFYGAGFVPGRPDFIGHYLVDIPTPGFYKLTLGGVPGGAAPLTGVMVGCTLDLAGMGLLAFVKPEPRVLAPGTYVLGIGFPARPEARGQATVRLEYLGPPTE